MRFFNLERNQLLARYQYWLSNTEGEIKAELEAIEDDEKELEDRFYCDLSFGTAGMRGLMGAGTNRMNHYTVRKATRGLAARLKNEGAEEGGVAVAYDTRNRSADFAREAALTMAACGIKAYLFRMPSATPLLSYAVRKLGCSAGIVITASHNGKEYNGYKVYDRFGCQPVSSVAAEIASFIWEASPFEPNPPEAELRRCGLLEDLGEEMMKSFCYETMKQSHSLSKEAVSALKVVYTPLHGAGLMPVTFTLGEKGYDVRVVEEQAAADGNFPTVKKPNPEERDALSMGIRQAKECGADLVLGTDPDCDRVGIAVLDDGGYRLFNGNQLGALLVNYILTRRKERLKKNSVIMKSIVTNDFGAAVAKSCGVETVETLTGFKYIGEAMTAYEETGEHDFLMGYEESGGFLIGKHVRDKDAVVTSLLICEMAAYYKQQGYNLCDILRSLHHRFGYYLDAVDSVTYAGSSGKARMKEIMNALRQKTDLFGDEAVTVCDYAEGLGGLPPTDALKYIFEDGSWAAIRPSGTEPKLKIYYSVKAKNERAASARLMRYSDILLEAAE